MWTSKRIFLPKSKGSFKVLRDGEKRKEENPTLSKEERMGSYDHLARKAAGNTAGPGVLSGRREGSRALASNPGLRNGVSLKDWIARVHFLAGIWRLT